MRLHFANYLLVTVGFILSPLSWWNDMVVNVPLAYLFSLPFTLLSGDLFLPSFLLGYLLSNLLGFLMMHWGGAALLRQQRPTMSMKRSLFVSVVYLIILIVFVVLDWIPSPSELLQKG